MDQFFVYWIRNGSANYIGATVDPDRRLRQHNGEITGGARHTTRRTGVWKFHLVVGGFRTWREALQFEWAFKYHCRRKRSVFERQKALDELFKKQKWTSQSPLARDVPLIVIEASDMDLLRE